MRCFPIYSTIFPSVLDREVDENRGGNTKFRGDTAMLLRGKVRLKVAGCGALKKRGVKRYDSEIITINDHVPGKLGTPLVKVVLEKFVTSNRLKSIRRVSLHCPCNYQTADFLSVCRKFETARNASDVY